MNKLKRLISILLCMAMMFTTFGVFAEETAETKPVTIDVDWESIGLLEALGIVDAVDEVSAQDFLNEKISRAEFAVSIIRFANVENVISAGNGFKDVLPESFEAPYIYTAVDMGLIAPVNEEYFYPGYGINYKDAAQALVMTLGYTSVAQHDDSWLRQAKKLGVLSGVDTGAAFTREQAYKMLFNALHADVMEVSSMTGDIMDYTTREGYDALDKFFGVKHDEGKITLAGGVELNVGKLAASTEYIKQNGNLYKFGEHSMSELLGRNAVVYYNDNDEAIYILKKRNNELTLNAADIIKYSNFVYTYGDSKKVAKLSNPNIILNGEEYFGEDTIAVMQPVSGSVTLVDNDNNSAYDIVFIKSYTDHLVKNKLTDPDRILDYLGNEVNVDGGTHNLYIYNSEGKELTFNDISANTIVSIAASTSAVQVYVSTDSVTGNISQMSTKYGKDVWRINDTDYTLSHTLADALASGNTRIDPVKMSQNYKFYLNVYGEIAFYEEAVAVTGETKFYAFITAAKMEGMNNDVTIKAYAKEFGGFGSLTLPKRITLNGSNASPDVVYNSLMRDGIDGRVSTDGRIIAQPVKMEVNEENQITYLAQASVREYYESLYSDQAGTQSLAASFPPYDTSITPEFELYMGHYSRNGKQVAYREILQQGLWGVGINNNGWGYKTGEPYVKHEKWPYKSPDGDVWNYRHMGIADDVVSYRIPYYKTGANAGTVAATKEDFFTAAGIPYAQSFCMYAYREGDSKNASYVSIIVDADAAATVGTGWNLNAVVEINRAYMNEEPLTAVKTNKATYYIKDGTIDINAVQRYNFDEKPMYEADGVTPLTYKVKPGDIINITVDTLGYITALEPMFNGETREFLADDEGYIYNTSNALVQAGSTKRTKSKFWARGTEGYSLTKLNLLKSDDGTIELIEGDPATMNLATESLYLTRKPGTFVKIEDVRGTVTTGNATAADLIGYEDSTTEYATILLGEKFLALGGPTFLYPHQ